MFRNEIIIMKLLSINLQHGGGKRIDRILDYLLKHDADFIVFGEYKNNFNGDKIREVFVKLGYSITTCNDEFLGVMVASKYPFTLIEKEKRIVGIEIENLNLKIFGVYVPTGSKDKNYKHSVWQKILRITTNNQRIPSIIVGDFNSCTKDDSMNQTEYNAEDLIKIQKIGWIDSWAQYNNDNSERYTWFSSYKNGFRLDYAFISPELEKNVKNIHIYHDSDKRNKITDHSPLVMEYSI